MPNKANMLVVRITYKLIGNDHMKAININALLDFKEEMIAKQPGRQSMIKVFNIGSISVGFEYGLKKLSTIFTY